jgi:hypothetical protein
MGGLGGFGGLPNMAAGGGPSGDQSYLGGGYGKYIGGGGGGGGYIDGGSGDGGPGAISYGGASGGGGATVTDGISTGYGGQGGGSPLYSTTYASTGNNLPVPGGEDSSPSSGVVVIKVWYG